jgi:hypothetical protein
MDPESADVTGHDVTTITCVCGNTVSDEGLIQANSEGIPVHVGATPTGWPNGLWMRTATPSVPRAAGCTVTRSSKRQGPRRLLSWSMSPPGRLTDRGWVSRSSFPGRSRGPVR